MALTMTTCAVVVHSPIAPQLTVATLPALSLVAGHAWVDGPDASAPPPEVAALGSTSGRASSIVVRQPRSHGWHALLPLPGRPCRGTLPQTLGQPAAVIGTANQPHAGGQHRLGVGRSPPTARQGRHRGADGEVAPLDGGRVDHCAAVGGGLHRGKGRIRPERSI